MFRLACIGCFMAVLAIPAGLASGREPVSKDAAELRAVNALIDGLYAAVTFEAGETPDWERARSFFLPEAVIVFAARVEGTAQVMNLDGWVQDFVSFCEDRDLASKGFHETIVGREVSVYGNIAHAFVVFEPRVGPDWDSPTVPGTDAINLVRQDGRWWITSITTQFSSDTYPIPERFRPGG